MKRLKKQIATEMSRVQSTPPKPATPTDPTNPDAVKTEQPSPESQRLDLASTLVDRAIDQMNDVAGSQKTKKPKDDEEAELISSQ